jgi:2-dehydro-3-deoxygalactonokinase
MVVPAAHRCLVAVDWGISSLRAARLDDDGAVLEERAFARGILTVAPGGFDAVFDECVGDWMRAPGALGLVCGMAGSRQGWSEAAYGACPAGPGALAAQLNWVRPDRVAIVPGLRCERAGVPDVMRGEETQVFGALRQLGLARAMLILPGTHSKWVRVDDGRIVDFTTAMTGEFYALLRQHSILARTLPADDGAFHGDAFDAGVAHALRGPGLLQSAFSVRTLALLDRLALAQQPSYLSGIVIGEELRSRGSGALDRVVLVGSPGLTRRYGRALAALGVQAESLGDEAAWRGLHDIAQALRP